MGEVIASVYDGQGWQTISANTGDTITLADTTLANANAEIASKQKGIKKMNIYTVVIVDKRKPFMIYNNVVVVASSRETASLKAHCDIPDDAEIEVIIKELGSFEPVEE